MTTHTENEIYSSRALNAPIDMVYEAFANPLHLKSWWGAEDFANTIHELETK